MAIKVSIINFKDGVGKTTLTLHIATYLARMGKKVLVIDVDHQSSLSIVMLGGKLWEEAVTGRKTCNAIFESYCNRRVSVPGEEIILKKPFYLRTGYDIYPSLDIVPAQFELDDTEIELAATTIGSSSEWDKRTLLANWIDAVYADSTYDFIIFDCPPATKFVSQNALAASDCFLIPVIPDAMSTRGVTHFKELVTKKFDTKLEFLLRNAGIDNQDVPKSYVPQTKMAAIVPSISDQNRLNHHSEQLRALRTRHGHDILESIIERKVGVSEATAGGWPVWNDHTQNIKRAKPMFEAVCKEIYTRLLPFACR